MLNNTDLLRASYVVAVDDDNMEFIVFNMLTVRQAMVKEVVIISPPSGIREIAAILSKNEFHALLVCEG
ncbi:MAG: CBS domain-containing membrane protein [Saprospiraceae bacterium]|jgi:CBS domain-containing membrane protein